MSLDFSALVLDHMVALARISGIAAFSPFYSSQVIPAPLKVILAVLTGILLRPTVPPGPAQNQVTLIVGEFLIGAVLGLLLTLVFEGMQLAGELAGMQLGFSLANVIDPQSQVSTTVLSVFHQTIAMLIFLQLEVHLWILDALARSFVLLPPGGLFQMDVLGWRLVEAGSALFLLAVRISLPVLIATMLVDIALGFLAKVSPHFPVLFVGIGVKALVGLLVLAASLTWWPDILHNQFRSAFERAELILLSRR